MEHRGYNLPLQPGKINDSFPIPNAMPSGEQMTLPLTQCLGRMVIISTEDEILFTKLVSLPFQKGLGRDRASSFFDTDPFKEQRQNQFKYIQMGSRIFSSHFVIKV